MRRLVLLVLAVTAALVLVPTAAVADSATHTYLLVMEEPNFGVAPNGDHVAVTGDAEISVHPSSVEGGGTFTHTASNGTVLATGSWEATTLLDYQSYGCGEVFGDPIPPNLCGGAVKMRVMLKTPLGELPGIMTIFCVIGPNPPNSILGPLTEGVTLDVPGVINFNHSDGGDNVFVQMS
jgi:hypothetical protein